MRILAGLLVIVAPVITSAHAGNVPFCPAEIDVTEKIVNPVPAGWEVIDVQAARRWADVGFLIGPLAENGELIPETANLSIEGAINRWDLTNNQGASWMRCSYLDSEMALFHRLGNNIVSCENTVGHGSDDISCVSSP